MKVFWGLLLLLTPLCLAYQAEDYQSGVIVLNDGRILAMRGDYERLGDEVQFLDDRGERVALPARMVDFEKTDEQNRIIREKSKDNLTIKDDGSLYSKIMRDKQRKGELGNNPDSPTVQLNNKAIKQQQAAHENETGRTGTGTNFSINEATIQRSAQNLFDEMNEKMPFSMPVLVGILVVLAVLALISFITEIYLIIVGFQESVLWGFILLFFIFGGALVPFFGGVINNPFVLMVSQGGYGLIRFLVILSFIIFVYPGNRLKIFILWTLPLWLGLILGIIFAISLI